MKAAVCRQFGAPLTLEPLSLADPTGHELKIRIKACAICHSDISYIKGYWGGNLPMIFGHEAAGVIEAVGDAVTGFRPGDRVVVTLMRSCGTCPSCLDNMEAICATPPAITSPSHQAASEVIQPSMNTGAFAEEVLVHERQCIAIPDDLDFETASLLGCGVITGFGAVFRVGNVKSGDRVGVIGSGGIGINAIQAARIAGASTIIAMDASSAKRDLALDLGATHFLNVLEDDVAVAVDEATGGEKLDMVFVAVGVAKAIENALPLIRRAGKVVILGMPASDDLARIDASSLASSAQCIIGTKMGSAMIREDIPHLIGLFQEGKIALDRLISHRYPFEDINTAIEMAADPSSARVVLTFD
ncbi:alcohol dehydrogenase catalytic domain-containing protein [Alphaproteobacteria bacterium LSUCC0684]